MDYRESIKHYLDLECEILKNMDIEMVNSTMNVIANVYEKEGTIYIFGNGGSASTASHYVNDFNKGISEQLEKKFRFICLNDNVPTVMAVANDIGYDEIFRFQLINKLKPNDLVIGISGSGNSQNVVNAILYAKECHVKTLGITGYTGGKVKEITDYHLHAPIENMQLTEDIHMIFDHLMMYVFMKKGIH